MYRKLPEVAIYPPEINVKNLWLLINPESREPNPTQNHPTSPKIVRPKFNVYLFFQSIVK